MKWWRAMSAEQLLERERPILFSALMVKAILGNRKTQTRRLVKTNEPLIRNTATVAGYARWTNLQGEPRPCPYGEPGDRLWVRESYRVPKTWDEFKPSELHPNVPVEYEVEKHGVHAALGKCRPGIFMPRWASRITLEIEEVRVEPLRRISKSDAEAEGIERLFSAEKCRTVPGLIGTKPEDYGWKNYLWHGDHPTIKSVLDDQWSSKMDARESFASLWESINGGGLWAENPWVWVITFKRLEETVPSKVNP
jgi:hypothetical protein